MEHESLCTLHTLYRKYDLLETHKYVVYDLCKLLHMIALLSTCFVWATEIYRNHIFVTFMESIFSLVLEPIWSIWIGMMIFCWYYLLHLLLFFGFIFQSYSFPNRKLCDNLWDGNCVELHCNNLSKTAYNCWSKFSTISNRGLLWMTRLTFNVLD